MRSGRCALHGSFFDPYDGLKKCLTKPSGRLVSPQHKNMSAKYHYTSETISVGGFFNSGLPKDFIEILNERAKDGQEFVAAIPDEVTGQGGICTMQLVFKRPIQKNSGKINTQKYE